MHFVKLCEGIFVVTLLVYCVEIISGEIQEKLISKGQGKV